MNSAKNGRDRRLLPRAVFSADENLTALARLEAPDSQPKRFKIMNISRGGLGLAIHRDEMEGLNTGGKLILDEISIGVAGKTASFTLPMEVAWIMDHDYLDNIGMGCKFSDTHQAAIESLVTAINTIFPGRIS